MIKVIDTPVWEQFLNEYKLEGKKTLCIAYITDTNLPLTEGDILLCDASVSRISSGGTSAKALKHYFHKGVILYSNQYIHSKFIVCDNYLLLGSANLTRNSNQLLEAAIVTDDKETISRSKALSSIFLKDTYTKLIDAKVISELCEIKVVRESELPRRRAKVERLGRLTWFLRCYPLAEKAYLTLEEKHEDAKSLYSSKFKLHKDDVHLLRWRSSTEFGRTCKAGDILLMRWSEKASRKSVVYPPSVILGVEFSGGYTLIYYDGKNSKSDGISYTLFKDLVRKIGIVRGYNARVMKISPSDLDKIKTIWK